MTIAHVGPATVRIIKACSMRRFLVNALLKDPLATLDENAKANWG
jgi:hypothetical protein